MHLPATHLIERARAKVNLTLRVLGRRPDGYHELDSIVAFAGVGDVVTLEPAATLSIETPGLVVPAADNLIARAVDAFALVYGPQTGRLTLDKQLPVAAGLGGGSADAAATLRLLARRLPPPADVAEDIRRTVQLLDMASQIGSDVTVCLASQLTHMRGRGHDLTPLHPIQPLPAVLVNANAPMPANKTAQVFKALAARPLPDDATWSVDGGAASTAAKLQQLIASLANDLEAPARRLFPGVDAALTALAGHEGLVLARMSGAGPTCFGLFTSTEAAASAAAAISRTNPNWWVKATTLS